MIKQILTTTDLSAESTSAVRHAAELAEKLDAKLTILCVSEFSTSALDEAHIPKSEHTEQYKQDVKREMLKRLETIRTELFDGKPFVRTELIDGRPAWRAICEHADHHGYDLIVMATRGHSGLERVLVGSTTERVVRHAHCPVLTLHAPES